MYDKKDYLDKIQTILRTGQQLELTNLTPYPERPVPSIAASACVDSSLGGSPHL